MKDSTSSASACQSKNLSRRAYMEDSLPSRGWWAAAWYHSCSPYVSGPRVWILGGSTTYVLHIGVVEGERNPLIFIAVGYLHFRFCSLASPC